MSEKWKAKIEERQTKAAAAAAKTMNGQNHIQFCDESTKSWKVKRSKNICLFIYFWLAALVY